MDEAERLCNRLLVLDHGRKSPRARPRADRRAPGREVVGYGALAVALATDPTFTGPWPRAPGSVARRFSTPAARRCSTRCCSTHPLRTLHRPANLEDLFLKLTGGRS